MRLRLTPDRIEPELWTLLDPGPVHDHTANLGPDTTNPVPNPKPCRYSAQALQPLRCGGIHKRTGVISVPSGDKYRKQTLIVASTLGLLGGGAQDRRTAWGSLRTQQPNR